MDSTQYNGPAKLGTLGGTLTVLLVNISGADILRTIILTSIGAIVSFAVSYALRRILKGPEP